MHGVVVRLRPKGSVGWRGNNGEVAREIWTGALSGKPLEIGKKIAEPRSDHDETTAPEPQPGLQGEGGDSDGQGPGRDRDSRRHARAPRSASARAAGPVSAAARPGPGARCAVPVRGAAAAPTRPPGTAGSRKEQGRRTQRPASPSAARNSPTRAARTGRTRPCDQPPHRVAAGLRRRCSEPVRQLGDAPDEPA